MAQALIRTTFARGRPVTAANPQRSGIGPHGSRVAFALSIWSASPGRLSSTKVLRVWCGTKNVHFEMKVGRTARTDFVIESETLAIESEKLAITTEKFAIEMENDCIETIAASCRTARFHFDRTREPYRTERGS
jgi:hypothetical protein